MRIAIGSDHRGFNLKTQIINLLKEQGHEYKDCGCPNEESVDYPVIAKDVCESVIAGDCNRGVLICGTGIGMSIAANKVRGIRAALCHNTFGAERARRHNDANILCLGAEEVPNNLPEIITVFLTDPFEDGKHQRRLNIIKEIEG